MSQITIMDKKGFKALRLDDEDSQKNIGIDTSMEVDPTGYPLKPNGTIQFYCSNVSANHNFSKKYSTWAWETTNSSKSSKKTIVNKRCLGIYVCKKQGCTSKGIRPVQAQKKSKQKYNRYIELLHCIYWHVTIISHINF